ncbi:MAG: response regulator transcription factor [Thermoanaerobaculia bacterium]|nr:response regulator transcription factor [Thermoanaerobaculia bacterium]
MSRLMLVDDHELVRAGLRELIANEPDFEIAAEAGTGAEALDALRDQDIDIVVLDLSLPDYSGIDLMKSMLAQRPNLRILILSMHPEESYARRIMRAGAHGYVNKGAAPDLLITAIRKVAGNGRFVSPALAELLALDLAEDGSAIPHERLSDREFEVFERLARGASVSEIAEELNLSPKTVSTHRSRILQKMDLQNNAELVRYAVKHGMLE